jgi:hypothetical protein
LSFGFHCLGLRSRRRKFNMGRMISPPAFTILEENRRRRLFCAALGAMVLTGLAATAFAQTSPSAPAAATPAATAPAAGAATAPKAVPFVPPVPPPSVPDKVNPFADDRNLPEPLKMPGNPTERMTADIHPENFDGLTVPILLLQGPDFEWAFDSFADWTMAPAGYGESVAFVYQFEPSARVSLGLYGPKDLFSELNPKQITQYLAEIRSHDPKGFVLLTAIPPDADSIGSANFGGFSGESVEYATVLPTVVMMHHDWFVDMNQRYLLLIRLSAPAAFMTRLEKDINADLNHGKVRKGFGVKEAAPAAPAATAATTNRVG